MAQDDDLKGPKTRRSLRRLDAAALDRLAIELDTGRYPDEPEWRYRERLASLLPSEECIEWEDTWTPTRKKWPRERARKVGYSRWAMLDDFSQ